MSPVLGDFYLGASYLGEYGRPSSGLFGPALGDVVIATHYDRGRQRLEMGGIRATWEVNQPGDFSAFARLSDTERIESDPANLRNHWLLWEHPYLGHWGGVITDVATHADGLVEIGARGWLILFDKRLTRRRDVDITAHAGTLAARIARNANAVSPTGILGYDAEESGSFVGYRDDGGEVLSAFSQLSALSDQDYAVGELDRVFYWRRRFGTDKTASVQLVQGYHIASWRASWALAPVITEVILETDNPNRFATAPATAGHDRDAYARFGPRQMRDTYKGRLSRSSVQKAATKQAEKFARRGHLIELDIVNADDCWDRFRRGDTVTVVLADINQALQVRFLLISWDQDSNLVRVSGEITG